VEQVTSSIDRLTIRRGGEAIEQHLEQTARQSADGGLRGASNRLTGGGDSLEFRWQPVDGGWVVWKQRGTSAPETARTATTAIQGPFAVQETLRASPMQAGERRRLTHVLPLYAQPAVTQLTAQQRESTSLLGGQVGELLRVDCLTEVPGQPAMRSQCWVDERGEVIKSRQSALDLTSYRSSRAEVTQLLHGAPGVDLLAVTQIPLERALDRKAPQWQLKIRSIDGQPIDYEFPSLPWQRVEIASPQQIHLTILRDAGALTGGPTPQAGDRLPNALIQSDNPTVVKLAAEVGKFPSSEALAMALAHQVHTHIRQVNYASGFLSAAEVAQRGAGDCTEHAVLLAAVCRARGLPARVAAGLIYAPRAGQPGLAWHLWTWAWIGDRWLPLDATLPELRAGADRIHLVSSDLADGNEYACLGGAVLAKGSWRIEQDGPSATNSDGHP
jgi:hypothetical protein